MPSGALQSRLNPPNPPRERNVSDAKVNGTTPKAVDSTDKDRTSFKDLIQSSNAEQDRVRAAQKNGDFKGARTDEEFAKAMNDKINKENLRVPNANLDKDAFLKLFITQMQNQDPLNPQESTEMASQLAQFHGLEQMLNVNKNLEKMTTEQATNRAVSLIDFVGKEVRINGGKLRLEHGKVSSATYNAERDVPSAMLEIRDAAGVLVGKKDLGALKKGENKLEFDGNTDSGRINDGVYTFAVFGKDAQGADVPISVTSSVKVTGVDLTEAGGSFYTELGKVRVNEIVTVGTAGFMAPTAAPNAAAIKDAAAQAGETIDSAAVDAAQAVEAAAGSAADGATGKAAENAAEQTPTAPQAVKVEMAQPGDAAASATEPQGSASAAKPQGSPASADDAEQAAASRSEPPQPRRPTPNPYAANDAGNLSRPPEPFTPRRI